MRTAGRGRRFGGGLIVAALCALVLPLGTVLAQAPATTPPSAAEKGPVDVNPAARGLLQLLNTGTQQKLTAHPGLSAHTVKAVMDYRASGKTYKNLIEFRKLTNITQQELEAALGPYEQEESLRQFEASRKPVPEPPAPAGKTPGHVAPRGIAPVGTAPAGTAPAGEAPAGAAAQPGGAGTPEAAQGKGPIGLVRADYYSTLPGFPDLDKLDPAARKEFLDAVNREKCTCGCKDETVAWCLVNDPGCPVVKGRSKKMYDDIVNKPPK